MSGYALAGGTRDVARMEASADGGRTWVIADLHEMELWTWQFWQAEARSVPGRAELVARAWDTAANSQPE